MKAERCNMSSAGAARAVAAQRSSGFPRPIPAVPRRGVGERCPSLGCPWVA